MEPRISLVTLGVADIPRAKRFYEALGWVASDAGNKHVVFFQLGGMGLSLYGRDALAEDACLPAGGTGFGGITLAHNVRSREDVDRTLNEARSAGGRILKAAQDVSWGGYSGYFADPDRHPWEVAWNPYFPWAKTARFRYRLDSGMGAQPIGLPHRSKYTRRMKSRSPFKPGNADEVGAFLRERSETSAPVTLRGGGSKSGFGRPAQDGETILDMSGLSGVTLYQPDELVLTAQAGTKLSEIVETIGKRGQCLAFEPPEFGALFGNAKGSTLGGVVASGWSGPRRVKAGAVRDHVLGAIAVGGDGALFKSGGRVVKNVTGFDLPKLLTGSHGTLCAMTEITIKVVPAPQVSHTIVVLGLDSATGVRLLSDVLGGPYEVSGAAHLPAAVVRRSSVTALGKLGQAATLIRLEGFGPSVTDRLSAIESQLGEGVEYRSLDGGAGASIWREIRDVAPLADPGHSVWRISLPAADAVRTVAAVTRATPAEAFYDWGGGLVWLTLPSGDEAHAQLVRGLLPSGHATLMRASADIRSSTAIFQPLAPALAALQDRVKAAFDPNGILSPGRMGEGG